MLLSALVSVTDQVAATRSRTTKTALLADLLRSATPEEIPIVVGFLLGRPRQGRIGIGWRTLSTARRTAAPTPTLTLIDIDEALSTVAHTTGAGSAARRHELLTDLMSRATSEEQDHLARVLIGEVRTGALEGVLTDAVAVAAELPKDVVRRAAMLSGDLADTARRALAGEDLAGIGLTPGIPVLPMLASTAATVGEAVEITGSSSVEYKLDGARLQVHRVDGAVTAYTRSLADITTRVPEVVELVSTFPGGDLVLDGETLTLDESGAARPFQDTMSRFGAQAARDARLSVWFFDVLAAEGRSLIDEPLSERREVLARVVGDRMIPGRETDSGATAQQVMDDALAAGHEGVLAKSLDAPYAAGRRGKHWVKVKPVHTYDLVVLGVEWGSGRRTGWLSNLHLGARDPEGHFGEPGGFVMVGKTFKGLTDEILRWQTDYFPTIETRRTKYAVMVEPTTVVEIAIDGVQRSTRYPGGLALRFARVKRYRTGDDAKPASEADTIDTLRRMLPTADATEPPAQGADNPI